MIKRMNWAVNHGGGEYGSEDSSDSDMEEEEARDGAKDSQAALTWAEAIEQAGEGGLASDADEEYSRMAMAGPTQTAAIGGYAGREFARPKASIVPSSEESSEDDEGKHENVDGVGGEGEGEGVGEEDEEEELGLPKRELTGTRKMKQGQRQKERRRARAKKDLLHVGAEMEKEAMEAEERRQRKLRGFIVKEASKCEYTAPDGKVMYRSPLFPDMKIYSAEQLRHHMSSKKYKKAELKQKDENRTDAQREALKLRKRERRARRQAKANADAEEMGAEKLPATENNGHTKQKKEGKSGGKKHDLTDEQIVAAKAKFAAKKARRAERRGETETPAAPTTNKKRKSAAPTPNSSKKNKRKAAKEGGEVAAVEVADAPKPASANKPRKKKGSGGKG